MPKLRLGNGIIMTIVRMNDEGGDVMINFRRDDKAIEYHMLLTFKDIEALAAEFDFLMRTW